jgi:hypothetical protein
MPVGLRSISGSRNLQSTEGVGLRESGELIAKFEVFDDVLDVLGETAEVVLKVCQQLLLAAARFQIAKRELGCVVKKLLRSIAESGMLLRDSRLVEQLFGFENGFLRRLQYCVQASQDAHRQNHVGILAALERA